MKASILSLVLAVLVTLAGGLLYGGYSQRWGPTADLMTAGSHLASLPQSIGDWKLTEELAIESSAVEMLECPGYVHRRYVHTPTGDTINLVLLVGPPGPIAVHTPEICYSSRAYEIEDEPRVVTLDSNESRSDYYWCTDFRSRNVLAENLRVYYAWSTGGPWEASSSPRFEFATAPMLYKLQLAAPIAPRIEGEAFDSGREFLQALQASEWSLSPPANLNQ